MEDLTGWDVDGTVTQGYCGSGISQYPCAFLVYQDSKVTWNGINAQPYHGSGILIDIEPRDLEGMDYCDVLYSVNGVDFTSLKRYDATYDWIRTEDILWMNRDSDNQNSISIRIEMVGFGSITQDYCIVYRANMAGLVGSRDPTSNPTMQPITPSPTWIPTVNPTADPTQTPTIDPSASPSQDPTADPTIDPTSNPIIDPTHQPTANPTMEPTPNPTKTLTTPPSIRPTKNIAITIPDDGESVGEEDGIYPTTTKPPDIKTDEAKSEQSPFSDEYLLTNWYYLLIIVIFFVCCVCIVITRYLRHDKKRNLDEEISND